MIKKESINKIDDIKKLSKEKMSHVEPKKFLKIDYQDWQLFDQNKHFISAGQSAANDRFQNEVHQNFISIDQKTVKDELNENQKKSGLVLCDLQNALGEYRSLVIPYIKDFIMQNERNHLELFNLAFLKQALFIYVPDDSAVKETLFLKQIISAGQNNFCSYLLIIVGKNSSIKIAQELAGISQNLQQKTHITVDIHLEENSKMHFYALDHLKSKTKTHIFRKAVLKESAEFGLDLVEFNAGDTLSDFITDLKGNEASAKTKVTALTTKDQTQAINTVMTNYGKNTSANIFQHGVLMDRSHMILNGVGKIIKGAHQAYSQQENRILMLSNQVIGDANPILLIDEDDVDAGHAASVGQVDDNQLYYMESRGIDEKFAKYLLAQGFLKDLLIDIKEDQIKKQAFKIIEEELANG